MNAAALVLPEFALLVLGVLLRRWANRVGLTLPAPVDATLSRLAAAAVPLGLLTVGATLRLSSP